MRSWLDAPLRSPARQPVHKGIVSAMGKKWCNTCFACTKCAELLTHSFFNVDGKPYCDTCAGSL